jgi:hypothetical protein
MVNHNKIVVFDMDETLGHFVQLGALYDVLEHIYDKPMSQSYFNQLIELYPNMLRPNILQILNYVKTKKQNKKCSNVYIYTNNQGPKSWGNHIRKYFESKLSYSLFDDIIGAYKIRGILNDERRSTNKKTFDDLQSITKIDGTTKICFLDDQYHKNMIHPNIFYIYLPDYRYTYTTKELVDTFLDSPLASELIKTHGKEELSNAMGVALDKYRFVIDNTPMDSAKNTTTETLDYLKLFFTRDASNKTRKQRKQQPKHNKTRHKRG